jgi:hypothetical protein
MNTNKNEIELALSRVALGVHAEMYKGAKLTEFEPQRKTVVHDAWHGKKLSARHQEAWYLTVQLFKDAAGVSPGNGGYGEKIGSGSGVGIPRVHSNYAQRRLEMLRDNHLHSHEFRLLHRLMTETIQQVKVCSLQDLGRAMDGYEDSAQARAAGVTNLHRLFDSLAEFHGI